MKQINIAVVGMSGTEKERGQIGVGKSCLCNRFVRPLTDDYFIDHISVLSQSDFSGRVVNNDHFLYWGDVKKTSDEGVDYVFHLIEQTEFMDDATFQPFKVGKMETYMKRCVATRVASAEKMMYICKNQLGIEKEYEQKILPDGRLNIDGFLCVFDVSAVPNRSVEKQVDFVCTLINNLLKTKKPVLLVTTKNDEANELYVREAEKICQRKEYKGSVLLVETSSHEGINIDIAFIALAQMIDKTKQRTKIITYQEAARMRKELLDTSTEAVTRLIRTQIADYHTLWSQGSKALSVHKEWQDFIELFGQEAGQRIFRRHIKKLREENVTKRLHQYMENFSCALQDLIPDMNSLSMDVSDDWTLVQNYLKTHIDFDQYFFECHQAPWTDLSDVSDTEEESRIPFDVLDTPEAETVFKNHVNALQQEQKRLEWKKQFKKLLEETGYVTPGKQLSEVRVLFMGRECFEALSEHDCQQIYDNHQREIIEKAKHNFQELLLEHADLFYHFKSIDPSGTITQDDIKEITDVLQEDIRYKMLDRLDQDRKLMLFQHLGFVHCPIREHCPAFPNCMDALIERIITAKKAQQSLPRRGQWKQPPKSEDMNLNLLILGSEHLAGDLINEICLNCGDEGEYIYDGQTHFLQTKIIDGNMESFKSIDFQSSGLVCVYSNQMSFEYLKESLEKSLLCNLELEDKFENLPLVLVYQPEDSKLEEAEIELLRSEGHQLADLLHGLFIDTSLNFYHHRQSQHQNYIYDIINHLIECLKSLDPKSDDPYNMSPDIRIILCMFCGDPFSVESVLSSIITDASCTLSSERSLILETFLGDTKRRIEIIVSSYHGANAFRDELVHGFILLYSTKRKASLSTLNAFSMNIPNLPMQIMAITSEGGSASAFFNNEMCQMLMTEGNAIADRLRAHFMTSATGNQLKSKFAFYTPFLKEVWDKKPEIEQAFHMEEPVTLDSGEGTLEHSMHHHLPQPPPRHESYMLKNNHDGSGSENYEHLPTRSLNSLNGPDDNIKLNLNDNSEKYPHLYMLGEKDMGIDDTYMNDDDKDEKSRLIHQGFQIYPPPTTPPEPAPPDLHMGPTALMRQLKGNLVSASQSSLDEITSDVSGSKDSLTTHDSGWLDDALFIGRDGDKRDGSGSKRSVLWNNFGAHHAFTTGRRQNESSTFGNKVRPKGPSQTLKQPGKLNLKNFAIVNDAIARMNVNSDGGIDGRKCGWERELKARGSIFDHAPLAAPEEDSDDLAEAGYSQVKEVYPVGGGGSVDDQQMYNYALDTTPNKSKLRHRREKEQQKYSDTDSESSSLERKNNRGFDGYYKMNRKAQTHKRVRKKRTAIPVQPPKVPFGTYVSPPEIPLLYQRMKAGEQAKKLLPGMVEKHAEEESSLDVSSPRDNNSPIFGVVPKVVKEGDREKLIDHKREKQKLSKEEEKMEKRRAKEDAAKLRKMLDKEKEQEKRNKRKSKGKVGSASGGDAPTLPDFIQSDKNFIPLFLEKCVQFIEQEGLDSEGIYRVPGNRAHVDMLYQKFEEEATVDIDALDIPVNAVATALKDFFSKHLPPLFDEDLMTELEDIAGSRGMASNTLSMEVKTDRSCRLLALRGLLNKMPSINFTILKYIFQHFVRVSENAKLNSMDSKNLAICWWPTLIPIEFTDMGHFEQLRPYLEDIVQTMIDQYPFLFCGKEAFVMV
ncbi:rho GTPase-activating protein 190 isoform X2 [Phlebotomus argentipes]|uniref:rho GTPase-activating protein 190 isoform X2 n=1 Tax=Phlebotomus argentipes TaxID=94469 RepID=UPI002892DFFE|nr:rho GTPase-activating protein 190 isoform X2 [Phlebotomus argentipes]